VSKPGRKDNRQVGSGPKKLPEWFVPLMRVLFDERVAAFWETCDKVGPGGAS
jgi:hypothetical protein